MGNQPRKRKPQGKTPPPARRPPAKPSRWKRGVHTVSHNPLIVGSILVVVSAVVGGGFFLEGGGDDPTIEEWDRQASKACLAFADETADIGQPDTHNVTENVRRARLWADEYRHTGDVIERIGTPADYAAEIQEFTALFDALGDDFDSYATDQAQGQNTPEDDRRAQLETARLFDRRNTLAKRLGARSCA